MDKSWYYQITEFISTWRWKEHQLLLQFCPLFSCLLLCPKTHQQYKQYQLYRVRTTDTKYLELLWVESTLQFILVGWWGDFDIFRRMMPTAHYAVKPLHFEKLFCKEHMNKCPKTLIIAVMSQTWILYVINFELSISARILVFCH